VVLAIARLSFYGRAFPSQRRRPRLPKDTTKRVYKTAVHDSIAEAAIPPTPEGCGIPRRNLLKVLITGGNGFLGRHVVAEFLRRGHDVRALVRPAARLDELGWPGSVEVVRADLRVAKDLAAAFDGVDVLVHLAAAVTGGEDAQFAATVVGTERLLDAMARSQTKRLVLVSSFSVYDWSAIRGELTEESPLESGADLYERDGYAVAKAWQERVVRRAAEAHGWGLTVLRPGFIWGRGNAYLACLGQKLGPVHLVFGGSTRIPLTHVNNCAHLLATATEDPRAIGATFNVVDDDSVRNWGYLGEYLRRSGAGGFRVPLPYPLAMAGVRLARWTSRKIFRGKGKLPSLLVPCRFEARFKPLRFSNRKVRETLGWQPPLGFADCLRLTYEGPAGRPSATNVPDHELVPADA
jgi:nucleoside-diphosphate-sugar epimerase